MQEKLNSLLQKYSVEKSVTLQGNTAVVNGRTVPLMPWRNERRFIELKNLACGGTLFGVSTFRVCRIVPKGTPLETILYRELDLCEWMSGHKITEIMTFQTDCAANVLAKLDNDVVCTIEVAATLADGAEPLDKHEIIAQRGIACDRVVDTQVPQQSVYVYTDSKTPTTYLDVDFELFGLSVSEVAIVRQAFDAARDAAVADTLCDDDKHLHTLLALSAESAKKTLNVKVGELA